LYVAKPDSFQSSKKVNCWFALRYRSGTFLDHFSYKIKTSMLRNYFKTAVRNLLKNKMHSLINAVGLSVGMAVAMLIGFWIWDEVSFNKYHRQYDRIAQVMQTVTQNNVVNTTIVVPWALEAGLKKNYGRDFKRIAMFSWPESHLFRTGEKKISLSGNFVGAALPEILTLQMLSGHADALRGPASVFISQSAALALFGENDPLGQLISMDEKSSLKVAGVYKDLPLNSTFYGISFMGTWDFYSSMRTWVARAETNWSENSFRMFAEISDNANMLRVSEEIKNIKLKNADPEEAKFKPIIFLQPMSKWHLFSEFKNGVNTGGDITYVWLFGTVGIFVLMLACINFMNLSTAKSEKRAKEVGIRKTIGSLRRQLILQFFCESLLMAGGAFTLSLLLVRLALPFFNELAGKQMSILWSNPFFWMACILFTGFTGIVAGSYPALYLSSFKPVKVLKGTFKAGRVAALPRKILVVTQFVVSVVLIIGTIVVFRQIQFAKNRPVGYSREGLVDIGSDDEVDQHYNAIKTELLNSGMVSQISETSSPSTGIHNYRTDVSWTGKDPNMTTGFANVRITSEYGKTVGWQFVEGRDFSDQLKTDSLAVILNEAAVKYMGLKKPLGTVVRFGNKDHLVIGVIKDMVRESPYNPVTQTLFYLSSADFDYLTVKINPHVSAHDAIKKIESVFTANAPTVLFSYNFVDEEYAKKFSNEERIGELSGIFAGLAIFISCLGLFGMASFMAEQRVKEIGVRKVLGASTFNLWKLLSKDFVILVVIALFIAIPIAYYFMSKWLMNYEYRSEISWWIFAGAGAGAIVITILTVSYQGIKAALMNPVKAIRVE